MGTVLMPRHLMRTGGCLFDSSMRIILSNQQPNYIIPPNQEHQTHQCEVHQYSEQKPNEGAKSCF